MGYCVLGLSGVPQCGQRRAATHPVSGSRPVSPSVITCSHVIALAGGVCCIVVVGITSHRMKAKHAARMRSAGETEASLGSLNSEGNGMVTQSDLDAASEKGGRNQVASDPANCSPQNSPCGQGCCRPLKCEPSSQVCMTADAVNAVKKAQREQKAAEKKQKEAERKQKAAEEKKRKAEEKAKKEAEREQKKKERQAKRKAERESKKKERERKKKERERRRKEREQKRKNAAKKKRDQKRKLMLSCYHDAAHNGEMKCHEMEHTKQDTPEEKLRQRKVRKLRNGKPQINFSDGDGGTWKTVAPNPWPPHNLNIKVSHTPPASRLLSPQPSLFSC